MSMIDNSLQDTHDLEEYGEDIESSSISRLTQLGDDWDEFYNDLMEDKKL